ncbi:hypothetical protein D3C72_2003860 [compost metagenome]
MPACTMDTSVPAITFFSWMVVRISPGRLGSSNRSVCTMRSPGTSSTYSPPNACVPPLLKLVNCMR